MCITGRKQHVTNNSRLGGASRKPGASSRNMMEANSGLEVKEVRQPADGRDFERDDEWYTPDQFVSSETFPYFKSNRSNLNNQTPYVQTNSFQPTLHSNNNNCAQNESHCYYNVPFIHERVSPKRQENNVKGNTKRYRTNFREFQLILLERAYHETKYCTKSVCHQLSQQLNVSERVIKVWFQNRRIRDKNGIKPTFGVNERVSSDSTVESNNFNPGINSKISQNYFGINNIQNTTFNSNATKTNNNGFNTNTIAEPKFIKTPVINTIIPQFGRESVINFCTSKELSSSSSSTTLEQCNILSLYPNTVFHHQ